MRKIETVFLRAGPKFQATPEVDPSCAWVVAGEGAPTRKYDGSACLFLHGVLHKRLEWKKEKGPPPEGWHHHSFALDQRSGHGWIVISDRPEDRIHLEVASLGVDDRGAALLDGQTYELCGPRVNGNPEAFDRHVLVPHGRDLLDEFGRSFDEVRLFLESNAVEGVVWHHPDGRMAKAKRRDFGLPWPLRRARAEVAK